MPLLGWLTANWQLKLLAAGFAVGLWIIVASQDRGEVVYNVPLDLAGVPPGLEVASVGTETVDVRLQGLRHILSRIQDQDLRVELDLHGAQAGDVVARLRPENVKAPRGVQVVRVTPTRVRLTLEPADRDDARQR